MFDLNFRRLVRSLTPSFLRRAVFVAYLEVLAYPLHNLYVRLLSKRSTYDYKIKHTSQVFSIENVLNDRYDKDLRRIYIEDGDRIKKVFLNTRATKPPLWLGTVYLRSRDSTQGVDFVVRVPAGHSIFTNVSRMQTFIQTVNNYKLVARKFKIMPV
jgi:hypothetical protein